jgi:CRP-like cAMP-binding protein
MALRNILTARPLWMQFRKRHELSIDQQKIHFFKSIPFFESLTYKQVAMIAKVVHERLYTEGEYIFEVNQPGAALFMILTGEVVIEIPIDNGEIGQVAVLSDNDFIGELALIDSLPRSASARVTKPTRAFALFRNDLLSLVKTHPDVACLIYRSLALVIGERLKATNKLLSLNDHKKAA